MKKGLNKMLKIFRKGTMPSSVVTHTAVRGCSTAATRFQKALAARCALGLLFHRSPEILSPRKSTPNSGGGSDRSATSTSTSTSTSRYTTTSVVMTTTSVTRTRTIPFPSPSSFWVSRETFLHACTRSPWTPPLLRMTHDEAMVFLTDLERAGAAVVAQRSVASVPPPATAPPLPSPFSAATVFPERHAAANIAREENARSVVSSWDVLLQPEALWFKVHQQLQYPQPPLMRAEESVSSLQTTSPEPEDTLSSSSSSWRAIPIVQQVFDVCRQASHPLTRGDLHHHMSRAGAPVTSSAAAAAAGGVDPPLHSDTRILLSSRERGWAAVALALSVQLFALGYLTFVTSGWDVMEPVCYFLTSATALVGVCLGIKRTRPTVEPPVVVASPTPVPDSAFSRFTAALLSPREEEDNMLTVTSSSSSEVVQDAWHSAWAARRRWALHRASSSQDTSVTATARQGNVDGRGIHNTMERQMEAEKVPATTEIDDGCVRWWQARDKLCGRLW